MTPPSFSSGQWRIFSAGEGERKGDGGSSIRVFSSSNCSILIKEIYVWHRTVSSLNQFHSVVMCGEVRGGGFNT